MEYITLEHHTHTHTRAARNSKPAVTSVGETTRSRGGGTPRNQGSAGRKWASLLILGHVLLCSLDVMAVGGGRQGLDGMARCTEMAPDSDTEHGGP